MQGSIQARKGGFPGYLETENSHQFFFNDLKQVSLVSHPFLSLLVSRQEREREKEQIGLLSPKNRTFNVASDKAHVAQTQVKKRRNKQFASCWKHNIVLGTYQSEAIRLLHLNKRDRKRGRRRKKIF